MRAESGAVYGIASVRSKVAGRDYLIMVDAQGNIFYDPADPEQGLYVVRRPAAGRVLPVDDECCSHRSLPRPCAGSPLVMRQSRMCQATAAARSQRVRAVRPQALVRDLALLADRDTLSNCRVYR